MDGYFLAVDWYRALPPIIREKATKNIDFMYSTTMFDNMREALLAFNWSDSPEGYTYWNRIHMEAWGGGKYDPTNRIEMFSYY